MYLRAVVLVLCKDDCSSIEPTEPRSPSEAEQTHVTAIVTEHHVVAAENGWQPDTVNGGALIHTERKLKESLTVSYRICANLAAIEDDVTAMLDEACDAIGDPATEECIAETLYCYGAEVTAEATAVRLLAPGPVIRRFQRIVERPQRWDEQVPDAAKNVEYEGQTVGDWIAELLVLADAVEEQCAVITESAAQIIDVEENLHHYLDNDGDLYPVATVDLES